MQLTFSTKTGQTKHVCSGWSVKEYETKRDEHTAILAANGVWHSMNIWSGGVRDNPHMVAKSGIMVDFDDGTTRRDLEGVLNKLGCSYVMVPSRNHMKSKDGKPECERWHVYIPFDQVTGMTSKSPQDIAIANFTAHHFGPLNCDPLFDGGRFFYAGGDHALCRTMVGRPLRVAEILDEFGNGTQARDYAERRAASRRSAPRGATPAILKAARGGEYWRRKQDIELGDGRTVRASEITEKTQCRCINPDHMDTNPSAFVAFNDDNQQFIHCSSCKLTWWELDWMQKYLDECFVVEDKVYRFLGGKGAPWVTGRIHDRNIKAPTPEMRGLLLNRLHEHPMPKSSLVVTRIKSGIEQLMPTCDKVNFEITLPSPIQAADPTITPAVGNPMVEAWMAEMFKEHADFIMNWISIYAFANLQKLPILVLNGGRGVGKSSFAEMVAKLYPKNSRGWDGEQSAFNSQLDGFLVHIDELPAAEHGYKESRTFYRTTKRITGSEEIEINEKYGLQYKVKNNLNIISTTNDRVPIHLDPLERPESAENNSFFVYRITRPANIDLTLWKKVERAFPGWVRTEGLRRYKVWLADPSNARRRYAIPCPITAEEIAAYEESRNGPEQLVEELWAALDTGYYNGRVVKRSQEVRTMVTLADLRNLAEAEGTIKWQGIQNVFVDHGLLGKQERTKSVRYRRPTQAGLDLWAASQPDVF